MAAAITGIAGIAEMAVTLAPGIIKLITGLVHGAAPVAEQKYPASGSGPVKKAEVLNAVLIALQNAAAAGTIPKALPPDGVIDLIVETAVTSMGLSGQLAPAAPTAPAPSATGQSVALRAGQSLIVTVA